MKIKYMLNPKYIKNYAEYKLCKNKVKLEYEGKKQIVDHLFPNALANNIDGKLLDTRNEEIIRISEEFINKSMNIEDSMDRKIDFIKSLIKERMNRNGKI